MPNSSVHIFSTHFMSTLLKDGVKSVLSWTAKKKINVFNKRFVFLPINAGEHWSLCLVVNPGLIAINHASNMGDADEERAL